MFVTLKLKKNLVVAILALWVLLGTAVMVPRAVKTVEQAGQKDFIKWVDFDVCESALEDAMNLDIETWQDPGRSHLGWADTLALLGVKYGGDFSRYRKKDLDEIVKKAESGETVESMTGNMKYFAYYREAYGAVLDGFLGKYEIEKDAGWETCYGLKACSPIAKSFPYSHYDDFGAERSYGFARKHLGHDMMAAVGTPVIAVESGTVEAIGWNQYGGWRIGIRSFDGKRYHYYAHLRQNRPYAQGLKTGDVVMAGDVIGYVGRTGYSTKENVNNINTSHLHYGLQLIFDESQKETDSGEIWIDVYALCCLLQNHQSAVKRDDSTKEWSRQTAFREEVPEDRFIPSALPLSPEAAG